MKFERSSYRPPLCSDDSIASFACVRYQNKKVRLKNLWTAVKGKVLCSLELVAET
jgi:hypothetical protein